MLCGLSKIGIHAIPHKRSSRLLPQCFYLLCSTLNPLQRYLAHLVKWLLKCSLAVKTEEVNDSMFKDVLISANYPQHTSSIIL